MKKIALLLITLLTTFLSQAQDVQSFVNHQLQTYPKSRLLDLYKSCFQDFMGAEHLVSDKQRVKAYLDDELNTTSIDDLMPWNYEPCGIDSNYYRISIRTIKESVISEDLLLDAFIRSANSFRRPSVDEWNEHWHKIRIVEIYRNKEAYQHHLTTPHFQAYKQGTLHMVKSLNLLDIQPLAPDAMQQIFIKLQ